MAHDLDNETELRDQTAVGHLLDRLIYDKIMAKLDDNWIDQLLAKDMRERVERVASMAMGKLLTRNYHSVNDFLATKIATRLTKTDFAKMVDAAVRNMFKEHGKELELAAKAAVQDAIEAVLTKQFKATLRARAAARLKEQIEKRLDETFLLPDAERESLLEREDSSSSDSD